MRKRAICTTLLALWLGLVPAGPAAAQGTAPTGAMPGFAPAAGVTASDDGDQQVVSVRFGAVNEESGLRLLSIFADGVTEALNLGASTVRRTVPGTGPEQFFYLDIDDGYVYGGINEVRIAVQYYDQGFAPIYLDYDAVAADQPRQGSLASERKRETLAVRGNTEIWRTATLQLTDARLAGGLGGADFRIGSPAELRLLGVSVWRLKSELPPPPVRVVLDGEEMAFTDAQPFIARDRVLIPVRAIFEGLGAQVNWYGDTRIVEARKGSLVVNLKIDSTTARVNGLAVELDVPAVIINDRTYVPLRFVAEAFGSIVNWDGETYTVTIDSGGTAPVAELPDPWPAVTPPPDLWPPADPSDPGSPAVPPAADPDDPCQSLPWWAQPASCRTEP